MLWKGSTNAHLRRCPQVSLDEMHEGMELEGIIRSVREFGAFVDVGYVLWLTVAAEGGVRRRLPRPLLTSDSLPQVHDRWVAAHLADAGAAPAVCWEGAGGDRQ